MKLLLLLTLLLPLSGCISNDYQRLVPEHKDADIEVTIMSPWGSQHIKVVTKVHESTNIPPASVTIPISGKATFQLE